MHSWFHALMFLKCNEYNLTQQRLARILLLLYSYTCYKNYFQSTDILKLAKRANYAMASRGSRAAPSVSVL